MLKGMTGFGSALASVAQAKATVEIKTLNHRYFDLNFYLPVGFGMVEEKIKQIIQQYISRGRVTVSIKINQKPRLTNLINKKTVKQYLAQTKQLEKELKIQSGVTIADLVKLPGVVETKETLVSPDEMWPAIKVALKTALKNVIAMRKREGRSISSDLTLQITRMSAKIRKIKERAKEVLSAQKRSLSPEEFSSFQKGSDINEELTRLAHYLTEIKNLLRGSSSVGKQIDFVAQEMQRETNTIGSKLQDKVVASAVIFLKSKIEKIREQAQNVE